MQIYTQEEVISGIESNDIGFVIKLIVDNNPTAVKDNLVREGALSLSSANYDKRELYDSVYDLYRAGEGDKVRRILSVPYSEGSESAYTRGLSEYIAQGPNQSSNQTRGNFIETWGPVIGTVLTATGIILTQTNNPSDTNETALTDDTDAKTETDEDKILGMNPPLFWGLVVLLVAVSLVLILSKKKN